MAWFGLGCRSCCPDKVPTGPCNYPWAFHHIDGACLYDIWPPWTDANPEHFGVFHFANQCNDVRTKLMPPDGASTRNRPEFFTNDRNANFEMLCEPHPGWMASFLARCLEGDNQPIQTLRYIDPGSVWGVITSGFSVGDAYNQIGVGFLPSTPDNPNPQWSQFIAVQHARGFKRFGFEWDKCTGTPPEWPADKCPRDPNETLWDYAQRCWASKECGINPGTISQILYRCIVHCDARITTRLASVNTHTQRQQFTAGFYLASNDEPLARLALAGAGGGDRVRITDKELTVTQPGGECFGFNDFDANYGVVMDETAEWIEVDITELAKEHRLGRDVIGIVTGMNPAHAWYDISWQRIPGCTGGTPENPAWGYVGSIYGATMSVFPWDTTGTPRFGLAQPDQWRNDPSRPSGCLYKDFTGAVPVGNGFLVRGPT